MSRILLKWLALTLCILMIPSLIGGVYVDSVGTAVAAAAVLGVLNFLVRPLLILLTLPLTLLTFGFFLLVINALMFQLAGMVIPGLVVESFGSAFFAALLISVVSWFLNRTAPGAGPQVKFFYHRPGAGRPMQTDVRDVTPTKLPE